MKSANRALELRPSYADAYSALTDIYITQSRFDEALVTARKAAELDPEDNEYQQELARVLWSLGRSEAAIDVVREAIARKPKLPFNYITLARYLLQTGHSGEAQYWTGRALELDPESQNLQFNYCLGLLQFWAVEEARTCLRGFLEEYPGNPEATNYLAHLTGDIELGLSNGRRQVEQNPDFWYRKMQLADWLVRAEAYEDLLALFREAFPALYADPPEVNDMTVWAARNVVQALQGLGREEDARKLIVAGLKHLGRQRKLQGTHLATGIDDVYFLAYAGEYDRAITRLREAIDRDWQFYSFGLLIPADLPQSFVEDPRFQEQVERLGKIMTEERAWYEENKGRNLSPSAMTTL